MTDFKNGSVKVSNDIIDQLIAESALHVDGVAQVLGYKSGKIDKKQKDGIVTVVHDNTIEIALTLLVEEGKNIYSTVEKVQESVKENVTQMLGLQVHKVNVIVKDIA